MRKIILASASPRRKELLEQIGIEFQIETVKVEEVLSKDSTIEEAIAAIAYTKALPVFKSHEDCVVIGADTLVYLDGKVLGKPHDEQTAMDMLRQLSGRTHQVITGVALLSKGREELFSMVSDVTFYELSEEEIKAYVASKEPLDKAGAYAIQGKGAFLVAKIVGDYYNIVGLPIAEVARRLKTHIA